MRSYWFLQRINLLRFLLRIYRAMHLAERFTSRKCVCLTAASHPLHYLQLCTPKHDTPTTFTTSQIHTILANENCRELFAQFRSLFGVNYLRAIQSNFMSFGSLWRRLFVSSREATHQSQSKNKCVHQIPFDQKLNYSAPFPIKILFPYAAIFYAFLCCWPRGAIFSDWFERYPARNWNINLSMSLEFSNRKNIAWQWRRKVAASAVAKFSCPIERRSALQWVDGKLIGFSAQRFNSKCFWKNSRGCNNERWNKHINQAFLYS